MYLRLKEGVYSYDKYCILPIREQDIYLIKNWRNSQLDILRQKRLLSDKDQKDYYQNVIYTSFNNNNTSIMLFSFLLEDKCIGYGGLTNIDWDSERAEVSFLLDDKRIKDKSQYQKDFRVFLKLIKKVSFEELNINRLFTETYDIRPWHVSALEDEGFLFEGKLKQHVVIRNTYVDSLLHGILKEDYINEG